MRRRSGGCSDLGQRHRRRSHRRYRDTRELDVVHDDADDVPLLVTNGHDDRGVVAASPAAAGAGYGRGASWRGGNGAGGVGMRQVELAAINGSVPVDRTILVPVRHRAVVDDAEIVGVFMAVGGELCSVEGQTTGDVGGCDGADR